MHDDQDSRNLLSGTRPRCAGEEQPSEQRYGNHVLQLNLVLTGKERDGVLSAQVLHVGGCCLCMRASVGVFEVKTDRTLPLTIHTQ